MAAVSHRDLRFDVPDEWEDRSVAAFAARREPEGAVAPSVVVTREPLGDAVDLHTFGGRMITAVATALPGFDLKDSRNETIGDRPALVYDFTWEGDSGPLAQRQVLVLFQDTVYSITYSLHRAQVASSMPLFERILSSVVFS